MRYLVAILTRFPTPGLTKTRLATTCGNEAAAVIHTGMLCDTVNQLLKVPSVTPVIVFPQYEPRQTHDRFRDLLQNAGLTTDRVEIMQGQGTDMNSDIFQFHCHALGKQKLSVLCSSDMPHYSGVQLEEMISMLKVYDVVYHPTEDGSCCPNGLCKPMNLWMDNNNPIGYIERFENRCKTYGLTSHQLSPMFDIDTLADLTRLVTDFSDQCPYTMHAIAQVLPRILHPVSV